MKRKGSLSGRSCETPSIHRLNEQTYIEDRRVDAESLQELDNSHEQSRLEDGCTA
jgi:hypothetical protein